MIEYVAAQAFLDKTHMGISQPREDTNHYTLGEIGGHNVVIAVLPYGEYGTNSATNVANNMVRTYPHIRIGLMVGIGGGAPNDKHDIRLGDVVVSTPSNGHGGVLQYDFGKTIQNKAFCMTGFLDQPPPLLRTAVGGLQAQYELNGHSLSEAIDMTLQNWPKLNKKKYGRPDISTDRLYPPDVVHNDERCCATATGDDILKPISRQPRAKDAHNPSIHYGLIGSANQLMKDAMVRDRLSKQKDILCFEMEAAGLMNHFPCLVIRGICDYSDSHKNKEWQGYAAMTAAAYTKDLLCQIRPHDVIITETKMNELVLASVSVIGENIEALKSKEHKKEDLEILDWISRIDYGPQQSNILNMAQQGTGQWFLNCVQYQDWLHAGTKTLFCPGMPGAGKTVLTSIIINDLWTRFREDTAIGLAYIYCDFRRKEEQKLQDLNCSLLKQLAERHPNLPEDLKDLYRGHATRRTRPSPKELSKALRSTVATYSRVYVVIDALDECEVSNGCRDRFLSEIFDIQSGGKVRLLATSRYNPLIEDRFKDDDIQRYLDDHISELPAFIKDDSDLRREIKTSIARAADGMFLLAQLYLNSLNGKMTFGAVRKALENLVTGSDAYEHAYNGAMERINEQPQEEANLAKRVLSWITFAKRPLATKELQHALSVKVGTSGIHEDDLLRVNMASMCAGLVTIDKETSIIRLVHYTTQHYFEKSFGRWFPNPHLDITKTCIAYLSFQVFESGVVSYFERALRLVANPFYEYACVYWGYHARLNPTTCEDILPFLQRQSCVEAAAQILYAQKRNHKPVVQLLTPLHYAIFGGEKEIVQLLLQNKANIEATNKFGKTPLHYAVSRGEKEIVQLLLQNKASVEVTDKVGKTPLCHAILHENEEIVRVLLKNGAKVKLRDRLGPTRLPSPLLLPWVVALEVGDSGIQVNANQERFRGIESRGMGLHIENGNKGRRRSYVNKYHVSFDPTHDSPINSTTPNPYNTVPVVKCRTDCSVSVFLFS
ncbi:hypothetical protein F4803DRAFT_561045 [Xylaria telfairii]|nr:hypothetical protein F4803DRAFT_561045 [Xylaria telfairii]